MKTFELIWFLHNPNLNKTVEAPNTVPLEAETLEQAFDIMTGVEFPRPCGLECIGVTIREVL